LTVAGMSLGQSSFSQRIRLKQTSSASTFWRSDSSIRCLIPSGYSRKVVIFASAGSNVGSATTLQFYATNAVSSATNLNMPTTGSVSVTIFGQGYGISLPTVDARVGGTACKRSFWSSESSILCKVNNGMNIFRDAIVSIEVRNDRMFLVFSFNAPRLLSIFPIVGPASGGNVFTLSGSGFSISTNPAISAQIGVSAVILMKWLSDSSVSGTPRGGSGLNHDVKVFATGQAAPDIIK
jgi:hypothetical protein